MLEIVFETHSISLDNERGIVPFGWRPGWRYVIESSNPDGADGEPRVR